MGVNFVKNRTQFLLGVDFRQISDFERLYDGFGFFHASPGLARLGLRMQTNIEKALNFAFGT